MIKFIKIVFLWNFVFFISLSVANDLLEEIVEGIKYHNSLIKDWKAICEITVRTDDGKIIKEEEVWAKKGEKIYREKRNEDGGISYIVSFDGEVLRITGDNKKGLIKIPTESDLRRAFLNSPNSPLSPHPAFLILPSVYLIQKLIFSSFFQILHHLPLLLECRHIFRG